MHKFTNTQLLAILKEALAAMEVKAAAIFKIRAYQNVISSIEGLTTSVYSLWEQNRLDEIMGIGVGIKSHLNELFTTGKVKEFEDLKFGLPDGMFALIGLRSIGAKRAHKLALAFKLVNRETAIEKLQQHAEKGEVAELPGFGEKSAKDLLEAINQSKTHKREKPRTLLYKAEMTGEQLKNYLLSNEHVQAVELLGSYRRREESVGDLDISITTNPEYYSEIIDYFLAYPEIEDILAKGDSRAAAVLKDDMQVDIRVIKPQAVGAMVQYFTGNKYHNVLLRTYALEKGMSLSEYGIKEKGELKEFASEEDFYKHIGIDYISPELRQGKNEIELAKNHRLPKLIALQDIKGDLHTHTNFSDGVNTLDEMVEYAQEVLKYDYIGISDHAPSVDARGHKELERIFADTKEKMAEINKRGKIHVLYGYEINILKDATLALPLEFMKELDYCIASIHTSYNQDKEGITKRLIAAIEHSEVNIIAHPTGRLINERPAYEADWDKVFDAAVANDKIFEINSQPNRMDLPGDLVRLALEKGVKFIISTDAHEMTQMQLMKYGIYGARRGFLEKENVVNTLSFSKLATVLGM